MLIQVFRRQLGVTYLPQYLVEAVPKDACVISIIDEGSRRPIFAPTQTVLPLTDYGFGLTQEDLDQVDSFAAAYAPENIYVHCYMGQQRSKFIAERIARLNPQYVVYPYAPKMCLATLVK